MAQNDGLATMSKLAAIGGTAIVVTIGTILVIDRLSRKNGGQGAFTCTYAEVVRYLVDNRPKRNDEIHGALLLDRLAFGGVRLTFAYVDENKELIADSSGRKPSKVTYAFGLDAELREVIADADIVLFD